MTDSNTDNGETPAPETRDSPVHLADEEELDRFRTATPVALVEFYTDGCGICQSMEPVLGNVARELDTGVGLVNPRDDPPLVERFEVQSVPLLVIFEDGDTVARRADGFLSGDELTSWVREKTSRAV